MTIEEKAEMAGRPLRAAVVTVSDRGYRGEREDRSGPAAGDILQQVGVVVSFHMVPDDREKIASQLCHLADEERVDVVITSGGTGLSPQDLTPEATLDVVDRRVPGIAEAIRARSLEKTDRSMLSRGEAGVRKETLIINLPGSPTAVIECLEVVVGVLDHAVELIRGEVVDCAKRAEAH